MKDKNLNSYNEGGSHQSNPLGGVPLGVGSNGKQNTVQEGETSHNLKSGKFIFSDDIQINKDMKKSVISEFNLPNYIKGKTYAEASKLIDNKFKDRNDNASLNTKEELLSRLAQAQEYIKMQRAIAVNAKEVPDMMAGQVPQGMNQFTEGGPVAEAGAGFLGSAGNILGMAGSIGSMLPGVINGVDQLVNGKSRILQSDKNEGQLYANQFNNTFKLGGNINSYLKGRPIDLEMKGLANLNANSNLTSDIITSPASFDKYTGAVPPTFGESLGKISGKLGSFLDKNKNDIARLAPVVGNLSQLSNLNKPNYESLSKLDNKYQQQLVDEAQLQNLIANQSQGTAGDLANASGGNTASLRANLLGNSLNRNKALSNAYLQSSNINRDENSRAQQFDLGVDTTNLQQSNLENDINARNLGAYQTQKSQLMSRMGEDIGNIGKERKQMEIIAKMYGYTYDGKYLRDKNGNVVDPSTLNNKGK